MGIERHKVFISYYHAEDQWYKDYLTKLTYYNSDKQKLMPIFDDYSVNTGDIDDTYLTDEQIRRKIRDEYMREANVLIVLCGQNTKNRKHVDWEIHTAMYDSDINHQMGILVINLPSIYGMQQVRVSNDDEKELVAPGSSWKNMTTEEIKKSFSYMPERILKNIILHNPITVVDWNRIEFNSKILMKLVDNAFKRKDKVKYDHSMPLRRKNTPCVKN